MRILLTKHAKVGTADRPKGWQGDVDDALGRSIIRDRRAVEVGAASVGGEIEEAPADLPASEPPPEVRPKRGRPRKE